MKYVAYYRVSTKHQGESGLGLEAQRQAVHRYIAPENIDAEFQEIETGTNKKYRPKLAEAIALCKKHDATLLIAKLDRLARNVQFVSNLLDSKVKDCLKQLSIRTNSRKVSLEILRKFNVEKTVDLDPRDYAKVCTMAVESLNEMLSSVYDDD